MAAATQTLLAEILDAHGGMDRWHQFSRVRSTVVSGGFLWGMKGIPLDDTPRVITSEFRRQWTRVEPFGQGDWHMLYQPHRVVIETQAGEDVAHLDNPRETFAGHVWETPWTPLQLAYFNGYAMWTYYNLPFFLGEPVAFAGTAPVLRRQRPSASARLPSRCRRTRACRASHLRLHRRARAVVPHATSRLHAKCGRHSPVRQDAGVHRSL
jgi:hypothetical protein